MKIIISHPTSNANNRAVNAALLEAKMLHEFHTTIASFPGSFLDKLSTINKFSEIKRREFEASFKPYTHAYPWMEVARLLASKFKLNKLTQHETGKFCVDAVYKNLDSRVGEYVKKIPINTINGVYAYEDGALDTFIEAKKRNLKCIYELPIAYWETSRKLLNEEAVRLPEWAETIIGGITDSEVKLKRKERELELADTVIVPSIFVKDSIPKWAENKKIFMAPFGSPKIAVSKEKFISNMDRPLRVLFVGSMSQRKGLGDLFEAVNLLDTNKIELVVLGSLQASYEFYKNKLKNFTFEPGRPHSKVLELMRSCDVFCLPSIVEGRALVMQEAMSQGLPIIITSNTGGTDLVIEGETGFLVPIRSPEKIADKLQWFIENRLKLPMMSRMAQEHAAKYTWEKYGDTVIKAIKESH